MCIYLLSLSSWNIISFDLLKTYHHLKSNNYLIHTYISSAKLFFLNEINKKTILCTNHLGWKENSLATNDWDPVELSRESWHPKTIIFFAFISHLVGKSSFKSRTECFLSYVINWWNVQDKWAFCGFGRFGLCVFIFSTWLLIRNDLSRVYSTIN